MMTGLNIRAACSHSTPHDTRAQPPPKAGYGLLRYILDTIEALPEIQELLQAIVHSRRNTRPGYPPRVMFRVLCIKYSLNERYTVQLIEWLKSSPALRELCGLGDELPSESTFSRFFHRLTDHRQLIEHAIASMVEQLHEELPELGNVVSIDSTDIEAYGNPNRNPVVEDDAKWGVRTPKNRSKAKDAEPFHGYKMHLVADAVHDVPLSYSILPANKSDSPQLSPAVRKTQETYAWLKPRFLLADRGYDSQKNHGFLVQRGITPIIHIRKPTNSTLHDGVYTTLGAPTCLGGKEMTFIRTDPQTGEHLYQCPAGGCTKFKAGKHIFTRCNDAHWEDPRDNLRVIGIVPRQSELWRGLYRKRQGIERFFSSAKRSRLLDKHQYNGMRKVQAHVALSVLTYLATMYARTKSGEPERMRHMRIRV